MCGLYDSKHVKEVMGPCTVCCFVQKPNSWFSYSQKERRKV